VGLRDESSSVRIVVLEPPDGGVGAPCALARLGSEARIEVVHDADACLARTRGGDTDVVVVDALLAGACGRVLDALRGAGPPVVVAAPKLVDTAALAWFRRGAADCVALAAAPESLAVAVLEQIRRWRAARERGVVERRIRDLERYSETIIHNMNTALLVVDPRACIVACNVPAQHILGRRQEDLVGRSVGEWFPDGEGRGMVTRTLREGIRFKGAETVIHRPDGSVVPVGISCAPIADAEAGPPGAVATFQDLSDLRQLQNQVLQNEKMASIGQLAAGVAHEINNPTGFIHANLIQMAEYVSDLRGVWEQVVWLQKCVERGDLPEARRASADLAGLSEEMDVDYLLSDLGKAIRESQEGSERIRQIVQDLRDFSHPDSGERSLGDVNKCLDSTANIVWPMMKHLVVLEKQYQDLPALSCYSTQLSQVFMNLLVNAYHAIEQKVGGSGETGRIVLRTERRGSGVVVRVEDDGVGIPPENLDRIFDPFFTTKRVGSGTGLGLSTSFTIVQRHGGSIHVESTPGRGSAFEVRLPLDAPGDAE
jgi:PAS domain S-box-containing protein